MIQNYSLGAIFSRSIYDQVQVHLYFYFPLCKNDNITNYRSLLYMLNHAYAAVNFNIHSQQHIIGLKRIAQSGRTEKPLILVLSPTRELAQQIAHESELLCTYHKFNTVVLVGKSNYPVFFHHFLSFFLLLDALLRFPSFFCTFGAVLFRCTATFL